MKIYKESSPIIENLFEWAYINHLAWSLAAFTGAVVWAALALVNAENQRNALATKQCADPVFKGEIDKKCLRNGAVTRALVAAPELCADPSESREMKRAAQACGRLAARAAGCGAVRMMTVQVYPPPVPAPAAADQARCAPARAAPAGPS
jgi:hypothetical protein